MSCGDQRIDLEVESRRIVGRECNAVRQEKLPWLLDTVRKQEDPRWAGEDRSYIKGQQYTLLSRQQNLDLDGRNSLRKLLHANRWLNTAYVLKASFGQLWSYEKEGWACRFFDHWKDALKWQRLEP